MIAGTAPQNKMPLVTLNRKHFERINGLKITTDIVPVHLHKSQNHQIFKNFSQKNAINFLF